MIGYAAHTPQVLVLRDSAGEKKKGRDTLLFHVQSDEYFGTLATVVSLLAHSLDIAAKAGTPPSFLCRETLEHMRDDLAYLQGTHRIVPKIKARHARPRA